jgi:serine/threonine protein kinase
VEFKVENLCGFLIRSKLMSPDEMLAMKQRWQTEAKDPTASTAFLKWLISRNYATEYQAGLLSRGLVDDFFLGQYKILERVGRGRMAGVYRSIHPSGQTVAIKVLPPSRAKSGQMLARFKREARLALKLNHPNVVRAFQIGESRGVNFLVMEYLEGEPLDEVLQRRKRLPPAEAVRLIHQALLGLQHIHEQAMVHRDLKPSNLMLFPTPTRGDKETTLRSNLKILDIGLAREFFDDTIPIDDAERAELTGEGVLLGTPDYLAPEQARDPRDVDIRADIYSLGCTLYHLLTGQPPFPDKNILNQMIRHATETPKPLQDFVPTIPEGLSQILNWMMAKTPEQRYPTPARAAQALDAFLLVTSEQSKPVEDSPQMRNYLTWLEASEKEEGAQPASPNAKAPVAVAKPKSTAEMPAAPAKPPSSADGPKAKQAAPAKKGKTPPTSPAQPILTAAPAMPSPAAPPVAVPTLTADQFDVELVDAPPAPGMRPTRRDFLMLGAGAGVMFFLYSFCVVVSLVISWLKGGGE